MPVNLATLVEAVKTEVNPPGETLFPEATDAIWKVYLTNAFWEARLDDLLPGYALDANGDVVPTTGTTELSRDLQQLIVFYAGYRAIRNMLVAAKTSFRAKAGTVEFETQQSATTFREILLDLKNRRDALLTRLGNLGVVSTYYADAVLSREDSLLRGDITFVGGTSGRSARGSSEF